MYKLLLVWVTFASFLSSQNNFTDNQIQARLNIVNGYSAECVMHKFYTNSGWTQIEGEIGRKVLMVYTTKRRTVLSKKF